MKKKVINEFCLMGRAIREQAKEIALIVIDKDNNVLVKNNKGMIDVPRIEIDSEANAEEQVEEILSNAKEALFEFFTELIDYRHNYPNSRGFCVNRKITVEYYRVITDENIFGDEYKFVSVPHIKSLLSMLKYDAMHTCIREELNFIFDEISNDMEYRPTQKDYEEHLLSVLSTKDSSDEEISLRKSQFMSQYGSLNSKLIIESTEYFIKNFVDFVVDIENESLVFTAEKVFPIKAFYNDLWYSDVLVLLSNENGEYLVSLYLLHSIFNGKVKCSLKDNFLEVKENNKVIGTVAGFPSFIINDTSNELEKINKKKAIS